MKRYEATAWFTQDDSPLVMSRVGLMEVEADTPIEAVEAIFARMNADDRPNGKIERSLSVGDVVKLEWFDVDEPQWIARRSYVCDTCGWLEV